MRVTTLKPVWRLMGFMPQGTPREVLGLVARIGDRPTAPVMVAAWKIRELREGWLR